MPEVRRDGGAWLPALLLALRTTAYGLIGVELVLLVLWALAPHSGSTAGQTLRLGLVFWTAAHHASIHLGAARIGVTPYLLTLVPFGLLHRGTRRMLAADDGVEAVAFVPALAVCYGVVTTAAALAARSAGVRPDAAEAFVGAAVLVALAAGTAVLRVRGVPERVPPEVAPVAAGAARAVGALLAAGLVVVAVTVVGGLGEVTRTAAALHPGGVGGVGLVLLDLLLVPTLGVYGASLVSGPGFGIGAHTSVSLAGAHLGAVPAVPVLAALPQTGRFPAYLLVLLVVPVAAGALGALRALRDAAGWRDRLCLAAATAVTGGVALAAVAWLADGSAGPGRLAVSGPSPWQVGLASTGELLVGALLVVAAVEVRARRTRR